VQNLTLDYSASIKYILYFNAKEAIGVLQEFDFSYP